ERLRREVRQGLRCGLDQGDERRSLRSGVTTPAGAGGKSPRPPRDIVGRGRRCVEPTLIFWTRAALIGCRASSLHAATGPPPRAAPAARDSSSIAIRSAPTVPLSLLSPASPPVSAG